MPAGRYDFDLAQGQTFLETWDWNGGTDISGYTANLHIFEDYDKPPLLSLKEEYGITLASSSPNASIVITAAQTSLLGFEMAMFDYEIISSGGIVTKVLYGFVNLSKEN